MRIMMSAAGSAVAPSIIRRLQSLGHYVIGHDSSGYGYEDADEFFQSPPATCGSYASTVLSRDFDLYLPFLDEELLLLAHRKDVACSPVATLETFSNKRLQQTALEYSGLPVAPQVLNGKIVAKPNIGRGGKGIIITDQPTIISGIGYCQYVLQKFIEGDEYTIDVLTNLDGEFLFAVPRLRIHANGVSVIGQIKMDEEIIDLARQVLSKFKFRGPINIQVIRERETGKLYIIEVNPRLSGSCLFTVMAGFDILVDTIRLWQGKRFVPPVKIDDGRIIRRHYVEKRL